MRSLVLAFAFVLLAVTPAGAHHRDSAQDSQIASLQNRVTALESTVRELDARLDRLEATPTPTPTPTATPSPTPTATPTATPTPTPTATPTPTPSPTPTPTPTPTPEPEPTGFANVWVDGNGGTCARQAAGPYADTAACGTFAGAYAAAQPGDTVRIKAGNYTGGQSAGSNSKGGVVTMIGEDGTRIVDPTTKAQDLAAGVFSNCCKGLSLAGNVTVRNVDIGGPQPFLYTGGNTRTTWEDSTFEAGTDDFTCGYTEPILILSNANEPQIGDITLRNIVVGTQTHDDVDCGGGTPFHLEQVRVDNNVDGVTFDRVTFERCPECGSGHIFITTANTSTPDPANIVVRNSVFKGSTNYAWQMHSNVDRCPGYRFSYNTFSQETDTECQTNPDVQWTGNLGPRSNCRGAFTRNVWQASSNPNCGSSDKWVSGPNYSTSALGLDSQLRPQAGSPALDAGEAAPCAVAIDVDGDTRPRGAACDAGADEAQ
jgi:hypothetical protein